MFASLFLSLLLCYAFYFKVEVGDTIKVKLSLNEFSSITVNVVKQYSELIGYDDLVPLVMDLLRAVNVSFTIIGVCLTIFHLVLMVLHRLQTIHAGKRSP